ncbi:MAG: hypothetical protein DI565_00680 [Ancylobacter novellus]|uniref:Uncharacterized protein n=1 Tax=Ancylobacter novellus TaxID=921 RepID=A0A2W5MHL1_ANCNO|nr:MAG: hypothetical protein DI565_00680 [Ancylobacter novellus]
MSLWEEQGGEPPAALARKPAIGRGLGLYWRAFSDLSAEREVGLSGPRPIGFSAIDRWARRYRVDDVDGFDRLKRFVRAMDAEWMKGVRG